MIGGYPRTVPSNHIQRSARVYLRLLEHRGPRDPLERRADRQGRARGPAAVLDRLVGAHRREVVAVPPRAAADAGVREDLPGGAPALGLFGTVWGIMSAFHGIGTQGSASLAVVAPGISEALIATAAGLAAAIPAVIGYNYFINRVRHWATEMDGFMLDLLNVLSRPMSKLGRSAKDGV